MKYYKNDFKKYIRDLGKPQAHPGGGSCAALAVCLGISLIQMAISYSLKKSRKRGVVRSLSRLETIKSEVFGSIDSDGELFALLLKEKDPAKKRKDLARMQKDIMDLARGAAGAIRISRRVKPEVRKSLLSDFRLGIKLCQAALSACRENLKVNQIMFGVRNAAKIARVKKYIQESA